MGKCFLRCAADQSSSRCRNSKNYKRSSKSLLAADDGLAVIAAALDARNYVSSKADCSHLVHDVYERAGFTYTYVPSNDLYGGVTNSGG